MKIYTKTGDDGTTSLYGGQRVNKHNLKVEAYGSIDELNAQLGLLRDLVDDYDIKSKIILIQKVLFSIGSILASTPKMKHKLPKMKPSDVEFLELEMDGMTANLDPMTHFILPGGHPIVSQCHVARCVCRRSERRVCQLAENEDIDPTLIKFINRLSDYLFILSRSLARSLSVEETKWITEN